MLGNKNINDVFKSSDPAGAKKEKIILIILSIVFGVVLIGALWDLYGQSIFCNCNCRGQNQMTANENTPPLGTLRESATSTANNAGKTQNSPSAGQATETADISAYSKCLENTKDERVCKDCCDCLEGDSSLHKICRDSCATNDFSQNTSFITFDIPSTLGQNGDYTVCTASGTEQECKQCCESDNRFACGDYQFCRTACNNKFGTSGGAAPVN